VRVVTIVAGIMALLSMGPHLHVDGTVTNTRLPFALLHHVPVVKNLLAGRLMLYVYLAGAVLLALAVDHLARRSKALAGAVAVAVLLPLVPTFHFPATRTTTPAFFSSPAVARIPAGTTALVAPFARDTSTSEPMLWQARAGMRYRMPAGYALGPSETGSFVYLPIPTLLSRTMEEIQRGAPAPQLSVDQQREIWADMRRSQVRSVIVGPMGNQPSMVDFFRSLLGRDPLRLGGVHLWTGVRPPA
jgi:hypothetical protein